MRSAGPEARLHAAAASCNGGLRTSLRVVIQVPGSFRPLVGPFPSIVARVSASPDLLATAEHGLPAGAARPEAVAVRLRRAGVRLEWGAPEVIGDLHALEDFSRKRGRSSLEMVRADPTLLREMQLGAWLHPAARGRALRRVLSCMPPLRSLAAAVPTERVLRWAFDAAFWSGARAEATEREWQRLTRSSYVALAYHRLAGEGKTGQDGLDVPPASFQRQMNLLRLLRFRPLSCEDLVRFHRDASVVLPRRSYVVTVDDGFLDCLRPLAVEAGHKPQFFVATSELGGAAWWADGEAVVSWRDLVHLERRGVRIGSHTRHHASLTDATTSVLEDELRGSRHDLRGRLESPLDMLSYPHGRHDHRVREAARDAGYQAAWTAEVGRNGAGTDPFCLRRVSVCARDGRLAFLWKVSTGELLPRIWQAYRVRRES